MVLPPEIKYPIVNDVRMRNRSNKNNVPLAPFSIKFIILVIFW